MLADERRLSLRMRAGELKISLDSVSNIVHEHLQKRQICARFVPHNLSDEQKQYRMETSRDFMDACDLNPQFLEAIITGNESWRYQYDPETKRQSMEWCSSSSSSPHSPKKCRLTKSRIKTLLIAFFDDLAPADFFLCPLLKLVLKGLFFSDIAHIQQRVTTVLRAKQKEAFADSFQQLYNRCQKCIVANGDYFECH
ncbi:hypothetical protein AVEN_204551-1 [Araneus ventricosus]|uniref:Mariner Mos1 transposase n=1 Tax=Araneus ventricosus TaxID=182803 RepID=A0A4Y2MBN4_ARAVE|nr:hypothetical protein AVEN_204551-1 [Araneus ventricosus]